VGVFLSEERNMRERIIHPEIFTNDQLNQLEVETKAPVRLIYLGLWASCDEFGCFKWNPETLCQDILSHDDSTFVDALHGLERQGFCLRMNLDGEDYGYIPIITEEQSFADLKRLVAAVKERQTNGE